MTYATYEPRSAAGLRPARGSTALVASQVEGEALHWPGMAKPINAVGAAGKARVASALRGWQDYHMDSKGWSDIAYMVAIDQVGRAWTLRGLNIKSGANGDADVNRRFGAFLLILAPGEQPSAAMKATVQNVIRDFRAHMPKASATPKGHRDVRALGTDCPGPIAYAAIKRGEFTPSTKPPAGGTTTTPPKGLLDMDLDDVVIAPSAGKPAVTVRGILAKVNWLCDNHGSGEKFEAIHANLKMADTSAGAVALGNLAQRLVRIETDTDRIP